MPFIALLIFVGLPLAEIALFAQVGRWIGVWPTVGLVVLGIVLGSALVRTQGLRVILQTRQAFDQGRPPPRETFGASVLILAGLLLALPGFLSDLCAFALILPVTREALFQALSSRASVTTGYRTQSKQTPKHTTESSQEIEGEWREVDPSTSVSSSSSDDDGDSPVR